MSTTPRLSAASELAAHAGTVVTVVGTYSVLSTGRHKVMYTRADGSTGSSNQVVELQLDGGTLDLWVRPEDEMTAFGGKRVAATGKLVLPAAGDPADPVAAAPDANPSLVEISAVTAE